MTKARSEDAAHLIRQLLTSVERSPYCRRCVNTYAPIAEKHASGSGGVSTHAILPLEKRKSPDHSARASYGHGLLLQGLSVSGAGLSGADPFRVLCS